MAKQKPPVVSIGTGRKPKKGANSGSDLMLTMQIPNEVEQQLDRKRVTRKSLNRYLEKLYLYNVPLLAPAYWRSTYRGVRLGFDADMNRAGQMLGYLKAESGFTVNNIQNTQVNVQQAAGDHSFESLARELIESKRRQYPVLEHPTLDVKALAEEEK
jgi:hypothetical protein